MKALKTTLISLFAFLVICSAYAAYDVKPLDIKLPSQMLVEKKSLTAPGATDTDKITFDRNIEGPTSASAITFNTGLNAPDYARTLSFAIAKGATSVNGGTITINGFASDGSAISQSLVVPYHATSSVTTNKAFASIKNIVFPASFEASPYGATYKMGVLDSIGLHKCMDGDNVLLTNFGGVYETTRPTCSYDVDDVEYNFCDPNSALNGSSNLEIFFIQNYRCGQ